MKEIRNFFLLTANNFYLLTGSMNFLNKLLTFTKKKKKKKKIQVKSFTKWLFVNDKAQNRFKIFMPISGDKEVITHWLQKGGLLVHNTL